LSAIWSPIPRPLYSLVFLGRLWLCCGRMALHTPVRLLRAAVFPVHGLRPWTATTTFGFPTSQCWHWLHGASSEGKARSDGHLIHHQDRIERLFRAAFSLDRNREKQPPMRFLAWPRTMIQIKAAARRSPKMARMASRQTLNTEVVRTAAFVLSIALIVWIAFSVW
jgi:hypothetical protein